MIRSPRSIFREKALRHYVQNQEKTVLPRFISPPVIFVLWAFLILFLAGGAIAWLYQIPVNLAAAGEISTQAVHGQALIVIIVSTRQVSLLHPDQPARFQIGNN